MSAHTSTTPLATPTVDKPHTSPARWRWLLAEPLVHFLLLGAGLFAINALLSQERSPSHIVVDARVDEAARETFREARQRDPDAAELAVLRQRWIDNEVLYREGLAMQLDKGDAAIRDRVIFKTLSVIDARLKRPDYDDKTMRAWFEANRARYDEPARYDFLEAVLAGERSEAAVRTFVSRLNGEQHGETGAGLRVFKARPAENIEQSYGAAFAQTLATSTPGVWQAIESKGGWRAVRLEAVTTPKPADFDALRNVVLADWTDQTMAQMRTDEVGKLARKYTITIESGTP
jgi:hypothetical protein